MQIISREEARAQGQSWYFTGVPCRHGHIDKRSVKGNACFECRRQAVKRHAAKNPEKVKETARAYYAANREERKAKVRAYHHANPEKVKAKAKAYYAMNRESLKARARALHHANREANNETSRAYYAAHREERKARQRQWADDNPEKARAAGRISSANRRARMREVEGSFTGEDVWRIMQEQESRCVYCLVSITIETCEVDHRQPIARGGTNWPENIQLTCRDCNRSKGARTHDEHLTALGP